MYLFTYSFILSSCCSTSSPAFGSVSVPDFGHSNRRAAVFYCCFNLYFPDDIRYEASFYMLNCHLYIFFGEVSVKVFGPFLNWVSVFLLLSCKSSLRILANSL